MALRAALLLALVASASAALSTMSWKELPFSSTIHYDVRTSNEVTINNVTLSVQYKALLESGKSYPGFDGNPWTAGTILDKFGNVVSATNTSFLGLNPTADPANARDFDFSSLFEKYGKKWLITHNEDSYGSFFLSELSQNTTDGELQIAKAKTLNTNAVQGAIRPCSGSLTPWKTHLAGLETAPDARTYLSLSTSSQAPYAIQASLQGLPSWKDVSPYWYGSYIEVDVTSAAGDATVKKHYAMGRAPWEIGVVFPDQRTVLCTADSSSGGLITLFVADKPRDLSSGRIYGMKPTQLNAADGGSFSIEWFPLHTESVNDSYVASFLPASGYNDSTKFADIFDYSAPVFIGGNTSRPDLTQLPSGYRQVRIGSRYEWLQLKPGMQALASVLETERLNAYLGGTNEWTKAEGATYDWRTREAYIALTNVANGMLDGHANDVGGPNAIRVTQNNQGQVLRLKTANVPGVSPYAPVLIRTAITAFGGPTASSGNFSCLPGSISNPDNIGILSAYRSITIAEDSDFHGNNFGWILNLDTGAITRIIATPYDAEVTGFYYFANLGSHSYLTATVQHPLRTPAVFAMPCTVGYWALPRE